MTQEWQPIETAPKDGTWVAVVVDDCRPDVARYDQGRWETIADALDWQKYGHDEWPLTHWMPLPEPPNAT
jgi:hypothetical protein